MARKRYRPNYRFYLMLALIAAIVGVVLFLLLRTVGGVVEEGTVTLEEPVTAVVIRDEAVVTAESYGKITYYVTEGERITSGTKIAEVYRWGTYDSVLQDLLTLQQEIRNYQVETILADIVNSELDRLDTAIGDQLDQISAVVQGESEEDLLTLEKELKTLMEERRDYLKNNLQPDDKLMSLYEREQTLTDRLESWKKDVYADTSGMISFYFDGYETVLNKVTMAQVLPSDITAVINGKSVSVSTGTTAEKPLYRIANPQQWYLAIVTSKNSRTIFVPDETYTLVLDGYYDKPYTLTALSTRETDGTILNLFEVSDDVGPVMGTRVVTGTVQRVFTGLTVAPRAIVTEEGQTGLYIKDDNGKHFVPVTVLANDGTHAVVRAADGAALSAGMQYSAN